MASLWSAPWYMLRGASFLRDHRSLWKYAAAPMVMSVLILGGSYILLYHLYTSLAHSFESRAWYGGILYYVLLVALTLTVAIVFFVVFGRIVSALAAPFNEVISRKTDELVTGIRDDTAFSLPELLRDSGRSLWHSLRILFLYVGLLLCSLVLLLIPVLGGILYPCACALISALLLAYEYLGYPMDRRKFSWQQKGEFVRSRFGPILGFGLGVLVSASIPVINLLFIPIAAVGGTLLFLDLNRGDSR